MRTEGGKFALRPKILELGYAYLSSLSLPELALPHMEQLVERVHESSSMCVLDGDEIVYVARVPTKRIMAVVIAVGTRFPAYATSMGRVLLAGLDEAGLNAFLDRADLRPLTASTVRSKAELRHELERVRSQGWALVDQELEDGLRSIATAIRSPAGDVVAAINLSTHASRRNPQKMRAELLGPLREAADAIERDLAAGRVP
jgi:IclR family pca regulon transcriptional regulator